ncbi:MAG TPA: sialate O-acetylesterase [Phycisphaerales bacterium]|nr:sialate O-acetylesterase [Phycisphaerales bacterium]|tara:strand:- start:189 stop:1763 length:1575 start_codon:yes stop_codon:yes gene_type:complete
MKKRSLLCSILCLLTVLVITQVGHALELPKIFATNMVIQRDLPIQVWGTAQKGSKVDVQFAGQTASTQTDTNGKWKLALNAQPANTSPQKMTVTGDGKTITYDNVVIGDVWICSGQSNMAWTVSRSNNADAEIKSATDSLIRLCRVANTVAAEPQDNANINWNPSSPKNTGGFSAVGYFFGRYLRGELNIPIGLIHTNWGGTPAEAWTSTPILQNTPGLEQIIPNAEANEKKYPQHVQAWEKKMADYNAKLEAWKTKNPDTPVKQYKVRKPRAPRKPGKNPKYPSSLFNGMINPIIPFGIKGAIWYQGEANSGKPDQYRILLPAMIKDWRDRWGQGDFPFGVVQLANFRGVKTQPGNSGWTNLQYSQFAVSQTFPNTGLAVINDIGEAKDIHPKNKQDVGKRLALWAMHDVYKTLKSNWSPPVYDSHKIDGNKVILTFKNVDGKLTTRNDKPLGEFSICGSDKKWVWAKATITGSNTIEVHADEIAQPLAVRYAWQDNPEAANLTDASGLPTSCFKTDDWAYGK